MTEENYTPVYAMKKGILSKLTFLNQAPPDELVYDSMKDADATVNSRLSRYSLPTFKRKDNIPDVLVTAANYYAVSNILQAIYGKEDRSTNEVGYYEKAENLMSDYVNQMLAESDDSHLESLSPYGISQSPDAFELGLLHR